MQIHHAKRNLLRNFISEVNDNQGRSCTFSGVYVTVSRDILQDEQACCFDSYATLACAMRQSSIMKHGIALTLQEYQIKVEITGCVSVSCQIYKPLSNDKTRIRSKKKWRRKQLLFCCLGNML